jgi:hypothetical protein
MAGLSLVVFPALVAIGVVKHLATPAEKRTEEANKYFKKFIAGVLMAWVGFGTMGEIDKIISVLLALGGIYLSLFSGLNLFASDPKRD